MSRFTPEQQAALDALAKLDTPSRLAMLERENVRRCTQVDRLLALVEALAGVRTPASAITRDGVSGAWVSTGVDPELGPAGTILRSGQEVQSLREQSANLALRLNLRNVEVRVLRAMLDERGVSPAEIADRRRCEQRTSGGGE